MKINQLKLCDDKLFVCFDASPQKACFKKRVIPDVFTYFTDILVCQLNDSGVVFDLKNFGDYFNFESDEVFDFFVEDNIAVHFDENLNFEKESQCFEYVFGTQKCIVYKNKNSALSIKLTHSHNTLFDVCSFKTDSIVFLPLANCQNISFCLARKSSKPGSYNFFLDVPSSISNGKIIISINLSMFKNITHNESEIWELVCKVGDKIFPAIVNSKIPPFESGGLIFEATNNKITVSRKQSLQKIKIAVSGTCFSRTVFKSEEYFNPGYKDLFDVCITSYHQSLICMMSKPIAFGESFLIDSPCPKETQKYGRMSYEKSFLQSLKTEQPKYLLVDTYSDCASSIFEVKPDAYITETYYFQGTNLFKSYHQNKKEVTIWTAERFNLFKTACQKLATFLKENCPNTKLVVVKTFASDTKIEGNTFSKWDSELQFIYGQKEIWQRNDDYLLSLVPSAKIIDMTKEFYYSTKNSPLTFSRNHKNKEYYKVLYGKFCQIVLEDIIKGESIK